MKRRFARLCSAKAHLLTRLLIFAFLFSLSYCKPGGGVDPAATSGTVLTDPNELSKVMIIPGATLEQGTPPAATPTSNPPQISTPTPEVSTISGQDGSFSINYSNVVGNITFIYLQFDGASYYFKIPISGNSGSRGSITIPMRIPDTYTITPYGGSTKSAGHFCCWTATATAKEIQNSSSLCGNNFSSTLPPRPGKGTATVGGKSYDATAICELDLGGFGKGYGIQINDNQLIILYNLKRGNSQLVDIINGNYNTSSSVPWAAYCDGSNIYYSTSGTAKYSGSVVSVSGSFADFSGNRTSISAAGNCQ